MADDAPRDARDMTDAEFDAAMKARAWRVPQKPKEPPKPGTAPKSATP